MNSLRIENFKNLAEFVQILSSQQVEKKNGNAGENSSEMAIELPI